MKVAIIGGVAQQQFFFGQRDGWSIWGLNSIRPAWVRKWSKMFNLHRFKHLERDCPQYVDWDTVWSKRNPNVPMYVVDRWPGNRLANQVLFPLDKLRALPRGGIYHAGSFDMMVAFAILLRAEEIAIHGVRLTNETGEPISARACLEYWIGVAEGRGIKVTTAEDCDMFAQFHYVRSKSVYGYDDVHMVEWRK